MTCLRCAELEDEIRYLRRELKLDADFSRTRSVARRLGVEPKQAELLLVLHAANGKFVRSDTLRLRLSEDSTPDTLRSHMYKARRVLGPNAITTLYGQGYGLSESGMTLVAEALA